MRRAVLLLYCVGIMFIVSAFEQIARAADVPFFVNEIFNTSDNLISNSVTSIAVSDRYVFVGTRKGLSYYDKSAKQWQNLNEQSAYINDMSVKKLVITEDKLWVIAEEGFDILGVRNKKWSALRKSLGNSLNIVNDVDATGNMVYLATNKGLIQFNLENKKIDQYMSKHGLPTDNVMGVAVRGDFIYVSCAGTPIYRLNFDSKMFIEYSPEDSSYSNKQLLFTGTSIWAGTHGKGLRELSITDGIWVYHTMSEGVSDDFVQSIVQDGESLWIGTFDGLNKFNLDTRKWSKYSIRDGLPESSITALAVDGNYLWIGTDNGLALANKSTPQVIMGDIDNFLTENSIKDKIIYECAVIDNDPIKEVSGKWCISSFARIWSPTYITTTEIDKNGRCKLIWDIKELPSYNDIYFVRFEATNIKGFGNSYAGVIKFDAVNPIITINPVIGVPEPGPYKITGTFNKDDIKEITINPGEIKAVLDLAKYSYSAMINLEKGINIVEVTMIDLLGRKKTELLEIDCQLIKDPQVIKRDEEEIIPEEEEEEVLITKEAIEKIMPKRVFISEMVLFYPGSVKMRETSFSFIENLISILHKNNNLKVTIEGYAYYEDVSNTPFNDNKELSFARALVVSEYLTQKGGIDKERLKIVGLSSSKVLVNPITEAENNLNRRVEIHITSE
ncbi:MAG: OmpA family protein [bacterium]